MAAPALTSIADLPALVASLPSAVRSLFDRIYRVTPTESHLRVPETMVPWVEEHFGPREAVEHQALVRVDNVVTGEGTLFNALRARRPVHVTLDRPTSGEIAGQLESDVWADPLASTPEDTFGRLQHRHGMTAANVARYDTQHSLIVFAEPDPLKFSIEGLAGHIELALDWFAKAQASDPDAIYPYLMWNCLWRAGGSVVHGHMQTSLARGRHFAKIERLRADVEAYRQRHRASYFDDLAAVHRALGLEAGPQVGPEAGVVVNEGRVLAHLTPIKEKEVLVLLPELTPSAAAPLFAVLSTLVGRLGVRSFNMGVLMPPLGTSPESWEGFPVLVRLVDRGPLESRTSDWGAMEMFAQSVVAADPFDLARELAGEMGA